MKKKLKNIISLLGCLAFTIEGIWLLLSDEELSAFMIGICWLDIIFFGVGGLFMCYQIFGPRKAVPITWNQHYLCISYGLYHREIEWKHITGFSPYTWNNIDWVLVHVDNVDEALASSGWYMRWSLKFAYKQYGALYAIQAENLFMTPQQLCEQLTQELAKHKPSTGAYI